MKSSKKSDNTSSYQSNQSSSLINANCNFQWTYMEVVTENGVRTEKSHKFVRNLKPSYSLLPPSFQHTDALSLSSIDSSIEESIAAMDKPTNIVKNMKFKSLSKFIDHKYEKRMFRGEYEKISIPKMSSRKTDIIRLKPNQMKFPQQSFVKKFAGFDGDYFFRRYCGCPCHKRSISPTSYYQSLRINQPKNLQPNLTSFETHSANGNRPKKFNKNDQTSGSKKAKKKRRRAKFFVDDKSYSEDDEKDKKVTSQDYEDNEYEGIKMPENYVRK